MTNLALLSVEDFTVSTEQITPEELGGAFDDIAEAAELTERLQDSFESIKTKAAIGRDTAEEIKALAQGFESLNAHFKRIPILSYTKAPSKTNLAITQESLLGSIGEAILKAITVVLKLIREVFSYLLDALLNRKASLVKVDALVVKAVALLDYVNTWIPLAPSEVATQATTALASVQNKHVGLMGRRWNALLHHGLKSPDTYRRSYQTLALSLQSVAPQFVESIGTFIADLRRAVQPNDVVVACERLDVSLASNPLLNQLATEFGYSPNAALPKGMTSYHALAQFVQSVIKSMSNNWGPKLDVDTLRDSFAALRTQEPWAGLDADTDKVMQQVQKAMAKLGDLDARQVAPQLAEVFEAKVPDAVKYLTSMAKGLRLVEDSMTQFADVRREVVVGQTRCLIDEVKVLDKLLKESKSNWSMQSLQQVEQKKKAIGSTWNV